MRSRRGSSFGLLTHIRTFKRKFSPDAALYDGSWSSAGGSTIYDPKPIFALLAALVAGNCIAVIQHSPEAISS